MSVFRSMGIRGTKSGHCPHSACVGNGGTGLTTENCPRQWRFEKQSSLMQIQMLDLRTAQHSYNLFLQNVDVHRRHRFTEMVDRESKLQKGLTVRVHKSQDWFSTVIVINIIINSYLTQPNSSSDDTQTPPHLRSFRAFTFTFLSHISGFRHFHTMMWVMCHA